jgi:hypothetical protein
MNDHYVVTIDECIKEKKYEEFIQENLFNATISIVNFLIKWAPREREIETRRNQFIVGAKKKVWH